MKKGKSQSGAAAVEFALVFPLFLAMVFAIFEVGWFYFVTAVVDTATDDAAREVFTGALQRWEQNPVTGDDIGTDEQRAEAFRDFICDLVGNVDRSCDTSLTVELRVFDDFQELAADETDPVCADADTDALANIAFVPGDANAIVRMRVCLLYETVNPLIGDDAFGGVGGINSPARIVSTYYFVNEPF